jgi:hypothetical protein
MDRATLISQVINIAHSHVGQTDNGDHTGAIVDWSIEHWTHQPAGPWAAWCAGFVSTCYLLGGYAPMSELGSLSCDALWANLDRKWLQFMAVDKYGTSYGLFQPMQGDLIFYRPISKEEFKVDGLSHVGLVQAVTGNIITSIEGNKINPEDGKKGVWQVHHAITDPSIHGYARLMDNDPFFLIKPATT